MRNLKIMLLVGLVMMPLAANADGIASLKSFYSQTQAMRADFTQLVTDKQGHKIQEVSGVMQLKRPNKFRWDYKKPYEQQIISDGKQVWLYDIDLAQVTTRSLSKALGSSPAALLAGENNLEHGFKLENTERKDNLDWVSAEPKDTESGFEVIRLGFKSEKLQVMELVDSFGHQTKISFTSPENNPSLNVKVFQFKAPKGVDVVGE